MTKATFELSDGWRVVRTSMLPSTMAEALEHSIEQWEFIEELMLENPNLIPRSGACALCRMIAYGCRSCPVSIAGHYKCYGTPYMRYYDSLSRPEAALIACRAEIAFLKSLRTEEDA